VWWGGGVWCGWRGQGKGERGGVDVRVREGEPGLRKDLMGPRGHRRGGEVWQEVGMSARGARGARISAPRAETRVIHDRAVAMLRVQGSRHGRV
jgi:hypothetical protein